MTMNLEMVVKALEKLGKMVTVSVFDDFDSVIGLDMTGVVVYVHNFTAEYMMDDWDELERPEYYDGPALQAFLAKMREACDAVEDGGDLFIFEDFYVKMIYDWYEP